MMVGLKDCLALEVIHLADTISKENGIGSIESQKRIAMFEILGY